jgi:hypothetical protein
MKWIAANSFCCASSLAVRRNGNTRGHATVATLLPRPHGRGAVHPKSGLALQKADAWTLNYAQRRAAFLVSAFLVCISCCGLDLVVLQSHDPEAILTFRTGSKTASVPCFRFSHDRDPSKEVA